MPSITFVGMANTVEIYALKCPDTGAVRYIGKANDSSKRLKSHIRDSRKRNTPVYCWFRSLQSVGKVPSLEVLACIASDQSWQDEEKRLIAEYRSHGARLLNVADGGDEPYCSPSQRQKNGYTLSNFLATNPLQHRLRQIKQANAHALKVLKSEGKTEQYNRIVEKLKKAADKRPDLFGVYASLKPI